MTTFFSIVLPIIIFLLLSLIVPIIIVLKWHKRPGWAMFMAASIYLLPLISLLVFSTVAGFQDTDDPFFLIGMIFLVIIWLLIGLIFLLPTQMKSRKNKLRSMQSKIDDAF